MNVESIIKHGTKRLPKVLNKDQLLKLLHQVEDPHTAMAIFMSFNITNIVGFNVINPTKCQNYLHGHRM